MTDNDTKKALECCCKGDKKDCFECPLQNSWDCHKELREKALDLINRQKAEIERLESKVKKLGKEQYDLCSQIVNLKDDVKYSKSEAIKEFAERLKNATLPVTLGGKYKYDVITKEGIDNLVKEMTEQSVNYGSSKTEGDG